MHHPHSSDHAAGVLHDDDHELYDITPDHGSVHHHHSPAGHVLYCPAANYDCFAPSIFNPFGYDDLHFGPADHNHETNTVTNDIYHEHNWQPNYGSVIPYDFRCACGEHYVPSRNAPSDTVTQA